MTAVGHQSAGRAWATVYLRTVFPPMLAALIPVLLGLGVLGAVILGGNGVAPSQLTSSARTDWQMLLLLSTSWALLSVPIVHVLRRAPGLSYLRSLPAPRGLPMLLLLLAASVAQLPWAILWLVGDGLTLALIATTAMVALTLGLTSLPAMPRTKRATVWRGPTLALIGIHVRGIRRTAAGALFRGAGLTLLTGLLLGAVQRSNNLTPFAALPLTLALASTALVISLAGLVAAVSRSQQDLTWQLRSLGISPALRTLAAAAVLAGHGLALSAIMIVAQLRWPAAADAALLALGLVVGTAATAATNIVGSRGVVRLVGIAVAITALVGTLGWIGLAIAAIMAVGLAARESNLP